MATIADIGTPGAPMDTPPLTAWQAAVRDALTSQLGVLTPTAPWSDASSGLRCTRTPGGLVTIEGSMKPASSQSMAVGTYVNLATIPVGFRPVSSVFGATIVYNGTAMAPLGFAEFKPDGVLRAMALTATTVATTGTVSFLASYRGA